jgi:hypothetical protein
MFLVEGRGFPCTNILFLSFVAMTTPPNGMIPLTKSMLLEYKDHWVSEP